MDNDNIERLIIAFERIADAMEERNRITQEDLEIFKEAMQDVEIVGKPH